MSLAKLKQAQFQSRAPRFSSGPFPGREPHAVVEATMPKDSEKKSKKERRKSEGAGTATLPVDDVLVEKQQVDRDHDGDIVMEAEAVDVIVKVCSKISLLFITVLRRFSRLAGQEEEREILQDYSRPCSGTSPNANDEYWS